MVLEYVKDLVQAILDRPFDQIIILPCQIISVIAAIVFYHYMGNKKVSQTVRHLTCATIGVALITVCYGWESLHLYIMSITAYMMILYLPAKWKGLGTLIFAVTYVQLIHVYNYIYHYMDFRVDVVNSLMIMCIKVTCLAFSVGDGYRPEEQLNANQLRQRLKTVPPFLEYFSFCFCFLGILFGPSYWFTDYMSFIEGKQYKTKWPKAKAIEKMTIGIVCVIVHVLLADTYSAHINIRDDIVNSNFLLKHIILYTSLVLARFKYYFCWLTSESICFLAGLGYRETEKGEDEWGAAIRTVNVFKIEIATSIKGFWDNWNLFTTQWLQYCIYERAPTQKVLLTFIMSATWHGVYPGYYFMFVPLGFSIILGRKIRRNIRPMFQGSYANQRLYDVITWTGGALVLSYSGCAFELKEWHKILVLQRSFYGWPHIAMLLGLLILPTGQSSAAKKNDLKNSSTSTVRPVHMG